MPVLLEKLKEQGWNRNNVIHTANDPILVATFRDEKTTRILFKYAPKITDLPFWIELFAELGRMENEKAR
jgi:hypothetical protein